MTPPVGGVQMEEERDGEDSCSSSSSLSSSQELFMDDVDEPTVPAAVQSDEGSIQSPCHTLSYAYQTCLQHDPQEQNHWEDVCRSYRQYATFAMQQWANHQYRLHSLPEEQRRYLPPGLKQGTEQFNQRASSYKDAAIRNQFFLDCVLRHAGQAHSQAAQYKGSGTAHFSTDSQMSKIASVLKSLARDWSAEGKAERDMAYPLLLKHVQKYLPPIDTVSLSMASTPPPRLCVPGAGLGRLACELSAAGYTVQGNEFSLYMLLASDFILNGPLKVNTPLAISPYLLESRNVHQVADPLRVVCIPDVDPYTMIMGSRNPTVIDTSSSSAGSTGVVSNDQPTNTGTSSPPDFSMAAGEFVSIYSAPREQGQWDGVVACFFLDASPSIVEYLQVIYEMLKPGGYLFHFGPLLWHWSGPAMRPDDPNVQEYRRRYSYLDAKYLASVDITWEDLQEIIVSIGFEIVEQETGHSALYTADRKSMMNMTYRCILFVARKPGPGPAIVPPDGTSATKTGGC